MNKLLQLFFYCDILICVAHDITPPFQLEGDCFLNVVTSSATQSFTFPPNNLASYTINNVSPVSTIEHDDDYDDNEKTESLTITQNFLRYNLRFRSNCILFYLLTKTFNDTLLAISNSGYGTSENVLFIVFRDSFDVSDETIRGFNSTLLFEMAETPFHVDMIFCDLNGLCKIFCLFCPSKFNDIGGKAFLQEIKSVSKRIKSNGYGNILPCDVPFGQSSVNEKECISLLHKSKPDFRFGIAVTCPVPELFVLASSQPILNVSIIIDGEGVTSYHKDWFLNVRQEGLLSTTPNVIAKTRGTIVTTEGTKIDIMVCQNKNEYLIFDFKFFTRIHINVRICVVITCLLYTFIYKNICKGIDFFFALLGKPFQNRHKKTLVLLFIPASGFFCSVYQSNTSSESVKILEFPSFDHFRENGYKFVSPAYKQIISLFRHQPNITRQKAESICGPVESAFYEVKGNMTDHRFYEDWGNIIEAASKYKLFIASFLRPEMFQVLKTDVVYFGNDILCNVFHLTSRSPISLNHSFRSWSYMSQRFHQVFGSLLENGIYSGIRKFFYASKRKNMAALGMRPATTVVPPVALDIHSAIVFINVYYNITNTLQIY
ncbi:unnamed protein product [Orchesella dallaii]|uniref:Uncharacterized protein n=1 Tax=Orchesella dallaii TaxID=48710 RepID=A0ABP1RGI8_9HEXA